MSSGEVWLPDDWLMIGAALQQQPRHRGVAVAHRKQQRRHAAIGRRQRALPDDPGSRTRRRRERARTPPWAS